jgi:hypothetical protein
MIRFMKDAVLFTLHQNVLRECQLIKARIVVIGEAGEIDDANRVKWLAYRTCQCYQRQYLHHAGLSSTLRGHQLSNSSSSLCGDV